MECPVCYDCEARCEFVCGHSFCYQCVKTWYQKGSPTCPMCRSSMCFKGILEVKKVWNRERREKVLENAVNEILDDPEDFEYGVDMMGFLHERFNTLVEAYPDIDDETLDYVLRTPWLEIVIDKFMIYYDIPTYMMYLMVSKTSYGVKGALGL